MVRYKHWPRLTVGKIISERLKNNKKAESEFSFTSKDYDLFGDKGTRISAYESASTRSLRQLAIINPLNSQPIKPIRQKQRNPSHTSHTFIHLSEPEELFLIDLHGRHVQFWTDPDNEVYGQLKAFASHTLLAPAKGIEELKALKHLSETQKFLQFRNAFELLDFRFRFLNQASIYNLFPRLLSSEETWIAEQLQVSLHHAFHPHLTYHRPGNKTIHEFNVEETDFEEPHNPVTNPYPIRIRGESLLHSSVTTQAYQHTFKDLPAATRPRPHPDESQTYKPDVFLLRQLQNSAKNLRKRRLPQLSIPKVVWETPVTVGELEVPESDFLAGQFRDFGNIHLHNDRTFWRNKALGRVATLDNLSRINSTNSVIVTLDTQTTSEHPILGPNLYTDSPDIVQDTDTPDFPGINKLCYPGGPENGIIPFRRHKSRLQLDPTFGTFDPTVTTLDPTFDPKKEYKYTTAIVRVHDEDKHILSEDIAKPETSQTTVTAARSSWSNAFGDYSFFRFRAAQELKFREQIRDTWHLKLYETTLQTNNTHLHRAKGRLGQCLSPYTGTRIRGFDFWSIIKYRQALVDYLKATEFRNLITCCQCVIGNPYQYSLKELAKLKHTEEHERAEIDRQGEREVREDIAEVHRESKRIKQENTLFDFAVHRASKDAETRDQTWTSLENIGDPYQETSQDYTFILQDSSGSITQTQADFLHGIGTSTSSGSQDQQWTDGHNAIQPPHGNTSLDGQPRQMSEWMAEGIPWAKRMVAEHMQKHQEGMQDRDGQKASTQRETERSPTSPGGQTRGPTESHYTYIQSDPFRKDREGTEHIHKNRQITLQTESYQTMTTQSMTTHSQEPPAPMNQHGAKDNKNSPAKAHTSSQERSLLIRPKAKIHKKALK